VVPHNLGHLGGRSIGAALVGEAVPSREHGPREGGICGTALTGQQDSSRIRACTEDTAWRFVAHGLPPARRSAPSCGHKPLSQGRCCVDRVGEGESAAKKSCIVVAGPGTVPESLQSGKSSPVPDHPPRLCSWDVDHAGCTWVVTLHSLEEQVFYGRTLEEALAWCLVWLTAPEIGAGPFYA
jgi:hypothetical protein